MKVATLLLILIFKGSCTECSIIIQHPKNVTVRDCQTAVTLDCKFKTKVDKCSWQRNDLPVAIEGRYKFTGSNRDNDGNDCSITINNPDQNIDAGYWTCSNTVDNNYTKGIKSQRAYIQFPCGKCDGCLETTPDPISTGIPMQHTDNDEKMNTVIIAMAAIGGIVIIIIIIIVIIVCWQCRKRKTNTCEHSPSKSVPESNKYENRYTDPTLQPMLLLQQGRYNFPPPITTNIHPGMMGMMTSPPGIQQQYQTLTTGQYLMPITLTPATPAAPLGVNPNMKPSDDKHKKVKPSKYENVIQDEHVYDQIDEGEE